MPLSNKHRTRSEECGLYSRIIRKNSVQLCNLHHRDNYDSISAKTARHWNFKGLFYLILYKRVTFFCVIVTVGLWVQHHLPNPSPVFVKRENKKVAFQTQSSTLTITGAHIATLIRLHNKRFRSSYCTKV